MEIKATIQVDVGELTCSKGMLNSPKDPGWLEEWNEIGEAMIHAYRRGSGYKIPSGPSEECSSESSTEAETKSEDIQGGKAPIVSEER